MRVRTTDDLKGKQKAAAKANEADPKKESKKSDLGEFADMTPEARYSIALERIRVYSDQRSKAGELIGKIVVDACYDNDGEAALGPNADTNEVFQRLTTSVGTLSFSISPTEFSEMRRVAAVTLETDSHHWGLLKYGHKKRLVQLSSLEVIEEGAKHAIDMNLTVRALQKWIDVKRGKGQGRRKTLRGVRLKTTRAAFGAITKAGDDASAERIAREYDSLTPDEQKKVREEVDAAYAVLQKMRRKWGHDT